MKNRFMNHCKRVVLSLTVFRFISLPVIFLLYICFFHELLHKSFSSVISPVAYYVSLVFVSIVLAVLYCFLRPCGAKRKITQILLQTLCVCVPIIVTYAIPLSKFDRDFFFRLTLIVCLLCISSFCWSIREKSTYYVKLISVIVSIILYAFSVWLSIQSIHNFYKQTTLLATLWNKGWKLCFQSPNWSHSWLSIAGAFFTGSLVVISWSREKPCSTWNPYSAKELAVALKLPFVSLSLWVMILYAVTSELHRMAGMCCILLVCCDITTLFYCYHLQDEKSVRRHIIRKLNWLALPEALDKIGLNGIKVSKTSSKKQSSKREIEAIVDFVKGLQKISSHIIQNMKIESNKTQVKKIVYLIDDMCHVLSSSSTHSFVGIFIGMGCVPCEIDNNEDIGLYRYYLDRLTSYLRGKADETNSYQKDIYQGIVFGVLLGMCALQLSQQTQAVITGVVTKKEGTMLFDKEIGIQFSFLSEINQCYFARMKILIESVIATPTTPLVDGAKQYANDILAHIWKELYQ